MEKSFYIDSNVFIFAYSDESDLGKLSRNIIDMVVKGKIKAFTSCLTFDETFYKIKKLKDKQTAIGVTNLFLNLNNLNFIKVDMEIISYSLNLLKDYNLEPRDAIHLACALSKDIKFIISNDKDFDKIKEIKRLDIKDFKD